MIDINPKTKKTTFSLDLLEAKKVFLVGDFNKWDHKKNPMKKIKGVWKLSLALKPGEYKFKYLVDDKWLNDPVAHKYVPSPFGGNDSIVVVPADFIYKKK
ncbi:MAG: isoamylase early set domain-containing protein [candidate division Zixibacteria bacterium]|nr:isoamylase early set domain-containing protein [candidate division Zixibacteria bacterium]